LVDITSHDVVEELIATKEEHLLFFCTRKKIHDNKQFALTYFEAWMDNDCYYNRITSKNGRISYIGFFFYEKEDVLFRFFGEELFK